MDQWGFQGIIIMWEMLVMLFSRELLRDLANLNGVPLLQGSLVTMGNNDIFEGALARFGKISMEFLHWGGFTWELLRDLGKSQWSSFTGGDLHGNYCEIWENLNGVPSLGRFTRESYSCLKGASDEYSHGPMRSTVWNINWGNQLMGNNELMGLCRADLGKSEEKWCTHLVQGKQ